MSFLSPKTIETACSTCPIRHQAVCARCDAEELSHLEKIKYYRTYSAGQPIAWAGDELPFVGSVVKGAATLSRGLEDGRRQMVGLLLASDFLGRPGRATSPYDVTAISDIILCCFRRKPFEQVMISTPHIVQRLLDMSMDELDATREWMMILGRKTAREKVASLLFVIARRETPFGVTPIEPMELELPLSREAMADYLGTTIETVSRQVSALAGEGIIDA